MTPKIPQKPDDQVKAFRKAARELEADESEDRFQDVLRKIGKAKPRDEKPRD